jgi:hypothetical protein
MTRASSPTYAPPRLSTSACDGARPKRARSTAACRAAAGVMSVAHIATEPWAAVESVLDRRDDLAFVPIARRPEISFTLPDGQLRLPYVQDSIVTEAIARLREMYAD